MNAQWNHMEGLYTVVAFIRNELYGPDPAHPVRGAVPSVPFWNDDPDVDKDAPRGEYPGEYIRYRPTKHYVVGLLHPSPRVASGPSDDTDAELEQTDDTPLTPDNDRGEGGDSPETTDIENVSLFRPQTMAVSFKAVPGEKLTVAVAGARYERTNVVGRHLWQRIPVQIERSFHMTRDGDRFSWVEDVPVDNHLLLRITVRIRRESHSEHVWVTTSVSNMTTTGTRDTATLFQTELRVTPGDDWVLCGSDEADRRYRNREVPVRGHGCAARVDRRTGTGVSVIGEHFPVTDTPAVATDSDELYLSLRELAKWQDGGKQIAEKLRDAYACWIDREERTYNDPTDKETLTACRAFLARIDEGIALLGQDPEARWCFERANEAIRLQSRRSKHPTRRPDPHGIYSALELDITDPDYRWRPFQLAFLLANLAPVTVPGHSDRSVVDVIWMPTGGGKTEAYLGLAAYTILLERRRAVERSLGATPETGVTVLMRYTLRLLTGQQLQRAASTICALEVLRKKHPRELGAKTKFAIGAWLGGQATPNFQKEAVRQVNSMDRAKSRVERERNVASLLRRCPWCAADLVGDSRDFSGYRISQDSTSGAARVNVVCPDASCVFHGDGQAHTIPVYDVDEDIYRLRPEFLVGTIDKFARLATLDRPDNLFLWTKRSRTAQTKATRSPSLVIQDELHLIDGPLGSIAGVYEAVIDAIGQDTGNTPPRIVGATATTAGTADQVRQVYGREHCLVPPAGPTVEDSFFAREITNSVGKRWLGIYAPGERPLDLRARVAQVLAQAAQHVRLATDDPALYDPWWTNVCFFQSRRDVGLAASRITSNDTIRRLIQLETGLQAARFLRSPAELTAAAVTDVAATLARLEVAAPDRGAADIALATSMIEVGLDSARLGLMTIVGQPKTTGQYIQVAGRVGRSESKPGLVVTVFNAHRPRDLSAFETFHQFHDRLYGHVEHATVTPWAAAAQRRALAGAAAIWIRARTDRPPRELQHLHDLEPILERRVMEVDPAEVPTLHNELARLRDALAASQAPSWFDRREQIGLSFLLLGEVALEGVIPLHDRWAVNENMRSVDLESVLQVHTGAQGVCALAEHQAPPRTDGGDAPDTTDASEPDEDPI